MSEYKSSELADEIVEKMVRQYHSHLSDAAIEAVIKEGDVGKKITEKSAGQHRRIIHVKKVPALYRHLCGTDFVLEITGSWEDLSYHDKEVAIDEALCRAGWDDGPYVREAPIVLFPEIIRRRGFYNQKLKGLREELLQLPFEFEGRDKSKGAEQGPEFQEPEPVGAGPRAV